MGRGGVLKAGLISALTTFLAASGSLAQVGGPGNGIRPAAGAASVAFTMGEIGRTLTYGSDGTWMTKATNDGSLVISSLNDDPGWTIYKHDAPRPPYTLEVRVRNNITYREGYAKGAGVIFGWQIDKTSKEKTFYAAYMTGNKVFVSSYGKEHFTILSQGDCECATGDGFTQIQVKVANKAFEVSVRGKNTVTVGQDVEQPLTGQYGIFVSGAGRATFRDLSLK